MPAGHLEQRLEARHAEGLARLVLGLDQAVGEQEERVARLELRHALLEAAAGVEPQADARSRPGPRPAVAAQQELRVVAGVDVAQPARAAVEDPEEQRVVGGERLLGAHLVVERVHEPRQVALERQARADRRLHVRHQQRGRNALARDVAHQDRDLAVREREVVEEIAAHLARRDRDAADLGEAGAKRPARQELLLDAPADLELLADPLLLDPPLLVAAQVARDAVEGLGQAAELAAVRHGDLHAEVARRERLGALRERGEVARHAPRQRQDPDERHDPEAQAEHEVARRGRADLGERRPDRPRDRDHDPRLGVRTLGHHPVAGVAARGGPTRHEAQPFEHALVRGIGGVGLAVGVTSERDRALPPLCPRQDRAQQQAQLLGLGRRERFAARLLVRALDAALLRPRLHALEPRLELVGHDVDARRHLRGELARLGRHRTPERPLRALPGVERHAQERHDGQQEESERELGP